MTTTLYFIRHAQPDLSIHDDQKRPLTPAGTHSSEKLVNQFHTKSIDAFYSSPYKRAIDTIKPLATAHNHEIIYLNDFRERVITDYWIEDFNLFTRQQWEDFDYKLPNGECLNEVQLRNINTLQTILKSHPHQTIVIGTHGTALSTILNFYDPTFTHNSFTAIKNKMPWVVQMKFEGDQFIDYQDITK